MTTAKGEVMIALKLGDIQVSYEPVPANSSAQAERGKPGGNAPSHFRDVRCQLRAAQL
jgi:hypothetical protein